MCNIAKWKTGDKYGDRWIKDSTLESKVSENTFIHMDILLIIVLYDFKYNVSRETYLIML